MKIWVFGTGFNGRIFKKESIQYEDYRIEGFFDNDAKDGEEFLGLPKLVPNKYNCKKKFIVVSTRIHFGAIRKQLVELGLIENIDFVSLEQFFDKRAIDLGLPEKRIYYTDFWKGFDIHLNFIAWKLRKYYRIIIDAEKPDYIFCSIFGRNALKYKGVRCCYTGENYIPDFNFYDYVIGFDYINYEDRYFRWPLYRNYVDDFQMAIHKHENIEIRRFLKRDFCCRVVSNSGCYQREEFFEQLNSVKFVASAGKCKNNLVVKNCVKDKRQFLEHYKFNLAFENSKNNGYTTEKIIQAWAAGCIPIYWGNQRIGDEFNKMAMINVDDFSSFSDTIKYIMELEKNSMELEKILLTPILKDGFYVKENELEGFICNIMNQSLNEAFRRRDYFPIDRM